MFDFNNSLASVFGFAVFVGFSSISARHIFGWVKNKYPPGPKGLPFFGPRLSETAWKDFEQWGKKYGDIMYFEEYGHGILVLNSHSVAADLLDRRGANYSDRQRFIVNEILSRGLSFGMLNYGDRWRNMRRAGHEVMSKAAIARFYHVQQREALILTENLLQDSNQWGQEISRAVTSGLLSTVYDTPPILSRNDPLVMKFNYFHKCQTQAASPGLIEFFPWMKHLPAAIAPWKRQAEGRFEEFSAFFMQLLRDVEKKMDEGDDKAGFVGHLIRERAQLGLNDTESAWLAGNIAGGGNSTTEALLPFFLAMVTYPEVQRKCHAELDAVVGRSRMPVFEDRDNLPYLKATVRELLRWRPISPLGTEHVTKEDDWYRGYFIPKGTMCLANVWLMNRDPNIYGPDVDDFNPDRFIDEHGQLQSALVDTKDGHVSYGFGPRICPARHFANDTIFIILAHLLWTTTISAAVDENGNLVKPDPKATIIDGIKVRPPPFKLAVKPRFVEAMEMVIRTKELMV